MTAHPILALFKRDLHLAARHAGQSLLPLVFLFAVLILIPLGVGPGPNLLAVMAPGMVWVAALLSGLLALEHLFRPDLEDGTLEQWWVGETSVLALVVVRFISHWLITGLPVILISPLAAQMLYLPGHAIPTLMLSLLLGTALLTLFGGLVAALTLGTQRGGVLLAILIFPLIVPVLIFGAGATAAVADGLSAQAHLGLLTALLVLALTLVPLATVSALRLNIE